MHVNKKTARIAGLLYLTIFLAGIFAEFFVRQSLIVPGDAAATANNILAAESLYRLGITGDLIMIISDVALALTFYFLLKPVSQALSMLAAFFRLTQAAVLGVNMLNMWLALSFFSGATYLTVLGTEQLQALGLLSLNAHAVGYLLGLVFFGMNCLVFGYLVYKSGYFPRILGVLLVLAGLGYLIDSFAQFLWPSYGLVKAATFDPIIFAFIGEAAMCLWLLVKGINVPKPADSLTLKTRQADGVSV